MQDKKHRTINVASVQIPPTGILYALTSTIAVGTGEAQRIGTSIKLTGTNIRLQIEGALNANVSSYAVAVRIVIFKWKDGPAPILPDIFDSTASDITEAFYNIDLAGKRKFRILKDKVYRIGSANSGNSVNSNLPGLVRFQFLKKMTKYPLTIEWDSASNPLWNNLYMWIVSDQSNVVNQPSISGGTWRNYWYDG